MRIKVQALPLKPIDLKHTVAKIKVDVGSMFIERVYSVQVFDILFIYTCSYRGKVTLIICLCL